MHPVLEAQLDDKRVSPRGGSFASERARGAKETTLSRPITDVVYARVAMVVMNDGVADARVLRSAVALAAAGAEVDVFARSPDGLERDIPVQPGVTILQCGGIRRKSSTPTPSGAPPSRAPAANRLRRKPLLIRYAIVAVRRAMTWSGVPLAWFVFAYSVWRRARDSRWDVIHGHDLNAMLPADLLARRSGCPLIYDSHELWRHRNRVGRPRRLDAVIDVVLEWWLIRRATAVITVSPSIARWLRRTYSLSAEEVWLVRNTPEKPKAPTPKERSLRQMAHLEAARIVLYTGRITSGRGLEEAIDALPLIPQDVHLVLMGGGDPGYLATLLARARRNGTVHRVVPLSPVPHEAVASVAAEADAALVGIEPLCLSYEYALPNKLFEAVQAGVPVLATDLPDIASVVRAYVCGELYQPGDVAGLADAIRTVLANPGRYRAGLHAAASQLNWETEKQKLLQVYSSVLGPVLR